jgi:hypothetical protein
MTSYVPSALRRLVAARARHSCEYCLIHEDDTFFGCQIEHVIAEKHGGPTTADNLAYACVFCNRYKGSDIASLLPRTQQLVRLFNPRRDLWLDHFRWSTDGLSVEPLTDIGIVTISLLNLNHPDRLIERETLHKAGRHPPRAVQDKQ